MSAEYFKSQAIVCYQKTNLFSFYLIIFHLLLFILLIQVSIKLSSKIHLELEILQKNMKESFQYGPEKYPFYIIGDFWNLSAEKFFSSFHTLGIVYKYFTVSSFQNIHTFYKIFINSFYKRLAVMNFPIFSNCQIFSITCH